MAMSILGGQRRAEVELLCRNVGLIQSRAAAILPVEIDDLEVERRILGRHSRGSDRGNCRRIFAKREFRAQLGRSCHLMLLLAFTEHVGLLLAGSLVDSSQGPIFDRLLDSEQRLLRVLLDQLAYSWVRKRRVSEPATYSASSRPFGPFFLY